MPSVKFAPSVDEEDRRSQKRRRDQDTDQGATARGDGIAEKPPKAVKKYRPNEDELDDLDEWEQDDDEDDKISGLPSEKELLEAKRLRRQNRNALESDGKTKIDDLTSLAAEGIAIEPFHMRNEESDGTGFFDGDTYVFRRHNTEEGEDEEPDAWLDRLREDEAEGKKSPYQVPVSKQRIEAPPKESMDDLTNEQLYRKILPLLSDKETVSQALIRYGRLIKAARGAKAPSLDASQLIAQRSAKEYLNELTGAANALLLQGEVEIYQATKVDVDRHLPTSSLQPSAVGITQRTIAKQSPAKWEYQGKQDGAVHGPYTTEQMLAWVKAGYFVGEQRVKVRTIREERKAISTQEDLLADLLDDDEDENGDFNNETVLKKGEWEWSNEVDFGAYVPPPNC